jgi:hypothetical protein
MVRRRQRLRIAFIRAGFVLVALLVFATPGELLAWGQMR